MKLELYCPVDNKTQVTIETGYPSMEIHHSNMCEEHNVPLEERRSNDLP